MIKEKKLKGTQKRKKKTYVVACTLKNGAAVLSTQIHNGFIA